MFRIQTMSILPAHFISYPLGQGLFLIDFSCAKSEHSVCLSLTYYPLSLHGSNQCFIILKAPYRKTTLLKIIFESGQSVLCSCTDITSKLHISIFLSLVGNYYTVDQLEIVVNQKLPYEVEKKGFS